MHEIVKVAILDAGPYVPIYVVPTTKTPAAIREQSGTVTCRFQLVEGEQFSSLQVYKNEKNDPQNHFAVIKSLDQVDSDQNWLGSDRLSFQEREV